jgi:isopenicillin N synthase-like dioxygenase
MIAFGHQRIIISFVSFLLFVPSANRISNMAAPAIEIPVIDLAVGDEESQALEVRNACMRVGFFYLTNHGVPEERIDATFDAIKAFFSLPEELKHSVHMDANNRGWNPLYEEILDPSFQKKGDTKEGYYIGREIEPGSVESNMPLHGPNQWPDETLPGLTAWRETMLSYYNSVTGLAMKLLPLLALALRLPRDTFLRPGFFDRPVALLRPLHYTSEVSTVESGILACGAHSDYGMITLLKTDHVPGLQVKLCGDDGEAFWVPVQPRDGAFIVNLGDMLQRWSNELFRSTIHRVVNVSGNERYSIPFFFEPNFDCVVDCFPECCINEDGTPRPARYQPTTSGQHLLDMYSKTHQGLTVE